MKHQFLQFCNSFILFFLFIFISFSCGKDQIPVTTSKVEVCNKLEYKEPLSVENAKAHYKSLPRQVISRSDTLEFDSLLLILPNLSPLWDHVDSIYYADSVLVLVVPIASCQSDIQKQNSIVFFNDPSTGYISSRFLLIYADDNFSMLDDDLSTFSGKILQIDWDGHLSNSYDLINGQFTSVIQGRFDVQPRTEWACVDQDILIWVPAEGCYGGYWTMVPATVCTPSGGGASGNTNNNTGNNGPTFGNDPLGWGSNTNSSFGGGSTTSVNNITNYFNLGDFQGVDRLNAQLINQFKETFCLLESSQSLLTNLQNECGYSEDSEELYLELKLLNQSTNNLSSCVKSVILNDRIIYIKNTYGITLSQNEIIDLLGEDCIYRADNTCFLCHIVWGPRQVTYVQEPDEYADRPSGISCSSFTMTQIGNAWYTGLVIVTLKYVETRPSEPKPPVSIYFDYLTIQVPQETITGEIYSAGEAAEMIADVFDYTNWETLQLYKQGVITSAILKQQFLSKFQLVLSGRFAGGCTVNTNFSSGVVYNPPKFNNYIEDLIDDCN